MPEYPIIKRLDGKYEQRLSNGWLCEYWEEPETGLWRVDIYLNDVPEWASMRHYSLKEAEQAARNYIEQL